MRRATIRAMLALTWPLLLLACTPAGGEEPAAPPTLETEATAAPDATSSDAEAATKERSMMTPEADPNSNDEEQEERLTTEAEEERDMDVEAEPTSGAVTPVVVDLGEITPSPPSDAGSEPVEMPQPGIPDPSQAMSNKAAVDLANRLGLDVSEVDVASTEETEWQDSSLGCPKTSQNYSTVITPGFVVVLEAQGHLYRYHTDRNAKVVFCGKANPDVNPQPPPDD